MFVVHGVEIDEDRLKPYSRRIGFTHHFDMILKV